MFETIQAELIERGETKSVDDIQVTTRVKDGYRQYAVADTVQAFDNYILQNSELDDLTISRALDVLATLIDWNEIQYFESLCQRCFSILQSQDANVTQPLKNGSFNCIQALVNKGQDHAAKIDLIQQLTFLEILEHFQLQNTEMDIDNYEDEAQLNEEKFFSIMAGALQKLGNWCLELIDNVKTLLKDDQMIAKYTQVFERIVNRALLLVDTDKPRIAIPLLDFFGNLIRANMKWSTMEESHPTFQQIGYLL